MRLLRFVCSLCVLTFAVMPVGALPLFKAAVLDSPKSREGMKSKPLTEAVKAPVSFAKAVTFANSGAFAIAAGDVNGDGIPDVAVAGGFSNFIEVWLGKGDGTFQGGSAIGPNGAIPDAIAIGDVNGDGHPDLVASYLCINGCNEGYGLGGLVVILGNGDGTFQPGVSYLTGGYDAASLALGDLNGDEKLDVVVANAQSASVAVMEGAGDGSFPTAASYSTNGASFVALADLDREGHLDLVVAGTDGGISVLRGNGDGTFQSPVSYNWEGESAVSLAVGDLNGDGYPDIAVANYNTPGGAGFVSVLISNRDGTFQPAVNYSSGGYWTQAVAIGDVNGDGHPDLVVVSECGKLNPKTGSCRNYKGDVGVLLGNGEGTFQAPVEFSSGGASLLAYGGVVVLVEDMNKDGRNDVLVAHSGTSDVGLLLDNFFTPSKTSIASSLNPAHVNESVTFSATVSAAGSVPDGSVITFFNGSTKLGVGMTTRGIASLTTSFTAAGKYTIKASYPGDAFHKASSGTVKQVVSP